MARTVVDGIGSFINALGDFLGDKLTWLGNKIIACFNFLADVIKDLGQGLGNIFKSLFTWLGDLLKFLFQGLIDFIRNVFGKVFLFFDGLWYFIVSIITVIVLALKVILGLFGVLFAVIGGFFVTVFSFLSWSGAPAPVHSAFGSGFDFFMSGFTQVGGNIIAGVISVIIWLLTIFIIFKIVSE